MQLVVRWKVLVNKTKEIPPYISADIHAKWWVEPNDVTLPISACLLWCVLSVVKIMIEVAMFKLLFSTPEDHGQKKMVKVCLTLPWAAMMALKYVN